MNNITPDRAGWNLTEWGYATGLSRATLNRMIADGRLRTAKIGSRRIILDDPKSFLEKSAA